jgi:hypothetical protein
VSSAPPEHDDLMVHGVRLEFSAAGRLGDKCQAGRPGNQPPAARSRDAAAPAHMGPAFGQPGGP